ncbi:hypothetical protein PMAYCL1PPCAC_14321, partial [Pristionchus mayeri]
AYSPAVEMEGMPWSINLFKSEDEMYLAVFLARREGDYKMQSVDVAATMRLINHLDDSKTVLREIEETYTNEGEADWGVLQFIKWKTAIDQEKGFIKDGKITIQIDVLLYNVIGLRSTVMEPQKNRRGTPGSSRGRHSRTPVAAVNRPPVLKPIEVLNDLKRRAAQLQPSVFMLTAPNFTPKNVIKIAHLCQSFGNKNAVVPKQAQIKDKKEPLTDAPLARSNSPSGLLQKKPAQPLHPQASYGNYGKSLPATPRAPVAASALPYSVQPNSVFSSIISLKPADASLLPPKKLSPETKQKQNSLESLVTKINSNCEKKVYEVVAPSSSPSSSTQASADSSSNDGEAFAIVDEARKNKRKNSEPLKIISEEQAAQLGKVAKRGGKKKKKGGKRSPPTKKARISLERKESEDEDYEEQEESIRVPEGQGQPVMAPSDYEEDDSRLPPRIIVQG